MRNPGSEQAERVSGYLFVLATLGLAAVFYFAYASFVVLRQLCPVCLTMYVSVIGIFIVAAKSKAPLGALPSTPAVRWNGASRRSTPPCAAERPSSPAPRCEPGFR